MPNATLFFLSVLENSYDFFSQKTLIINQHIE